MESLASLGINGLKNFEIHTSHAFMRCEGSQNTEQVNVTKLG